MTIRRKKIIDDRLEIMRKEKNMVSPITNRFKSFAWRFGLFMIPVALSWIIDNLPTLGLPVVITGFIAYTLNEVTKYWAKKQALKGKTFFGFSKNI